MWTRVDHIIETSTNANTKFFALQVRALGRAAVMGDFTRHTVCGVACRLGSVC